MFQRLTNVALLLALIAVPASAERLVNQQIQSHFDPDAKVEHPKTHTIATRLSTDSDSVAVCASYTHTNSGKPNRGRVSAIATIVREAGPIPNSTVAEIDFGRGKVREGGYVACAESKAGFRAGDRFILDFTFEGRPAIREEVGEAFSVSASIRPVTR